MKKFLIAFFDHFESYLCQCLLVFFVSVVFMQIILRFLNMSLSWTEEIARFAFIWFILFGACYATRLCALNRVTVQFMKFPKKVGDYCMLVSDCVWLAFCVIMAWYGYRAVMDLEEFPYFTPALDWDLGKVYLVFPLSFALMAIRIVQVNFIKFVLKQEIADPDQESVKESQNALNAEEKAEGGQA
ncbi:TRAP transporter small permease [uncultured Mailhella sp.]|uniref:TRAP transporter small permease n=1 Tax=uncultured Mailhella sp. TaxID=1981031 RepID=UPI0026025970|nr:TRAP transporter small permease [uncultured Mailhella sp.]